MHRNMLHCENLVKARDLADQRGMLMCHPGFSTYRRCRLLVLILVLCHGQVRNLISCITGHHRA